MNFLYGKNKEEGYVLIASLLILLLTVIIGIAATNTAVFEMQIAGNDKVAKIVFYDAEGAAYEAAQLLENETDYDKIKDYQLPYIVSEINIDVTDETTTWTGGTPDSAPSSSGARHLAVYTGISKGSSLDITESNIHAYSIYGRSEQNNSVALVDIGFKKRF